MRIRELDDALHGKRLAEWDHTSAILAVLASEGKHPNHYHPLRSVSESDDLREDSGAEERNEELAEIRSRYENASR